MEALRTIFQEMGFDLESVRYPQAAALYALARLYNLTERELSAVYTRFGLTITSFNLLMLLHHGRERDRMTQQALSTKLIVGTSDIVKVVDRLERRGLVRRQPGKDRRSNHIIITAAGTKLLDAVWPSHVEAMEALAKAIQPGDAKVLANILVRVRALRSR